MLLWRIYVAGKIKLTYVFKYSARYFHPILTKFVFSLQILKEVPWFKFHGNPSSGNNADACGPTDNRV